MSKQRQTKGPCAAHEIPNILFSLLWENRIWVTASSLPITALSLLQFAHCIDIYWAIQSQNCLCFLTAPNPKWRFTSLNPPPSHPKPQSYNRSFSYSWTEQSQWFSTASAPSLQRVINPTYLRVSVPDALLAGRHWQARVPNVYKGPTVILRLHHALESPGLSKMITWTTPPPEFLTL